MRSLIIAEVVLGSSLIGYLLYKIKKYFAGIKCTCTECLNGKTVVITGANSGIGKELALELAKRGASLILACRNNHSANEVAQEISSITKNPNIKVKYLDLTSLGTIQAFVEEVHNEYQQIYALVNNAAIFYNDPEKTVDNYDKTLQVNYLGPVYLTHLLLDLLEKSPSSKIVNVASQSHLMIKNIDEVKNIFDCTSYANYNKFTAYGVSKLALAAYTFNLAEKLKGTSIQVFSADPGNCETSIFRNFPFLSNPISFAIQKPIRYFVIKTPNQGAQTILHTILYQGYKTGSYIYNCKRAKCSPLVKNITLNAFLMTVNNKLLS